MKGIRRRHSLTWIHPLHAIRKGGVGDQVVASPPRICHHAVCRRQRRAGNGDEY